MTQKRYNLGKNLTQNSDGGLLYGNGCRRWPDCFTCPYEEGCRAGDSSILPFMNVPREEKKQAVQPKRNGRKATGANVGGFSDEGQFQEALDELDRFAVK